MEGERVKKRGDGEREREEKRNKVGRFRGREKERRGKEGSYESWPGLDKVY